VTDTATPVNINSQYCHWSNLQAAGGITFTGAGGTHNTLTNIYAGGVGGGALALLINNNYNSICNASYTGTCTISGSFNTVTNLQMTETTNLGLLSITGNNNVISGVAPGTRITAGSAGNVSITGNNNAVSNLFIPGDGGGGGQAQLFTVGGNDNQLENITLGEGPPINNTTVNGGSFGTNSFFPGTGTGSIVTLGGTGTKVSNLNYCAKQDTANNPGVSAAAASRVQITSTFGVYSNCYFYRDNVNYNLFGQLNIFVGGVRNSFVNCRVGPNVDPSGGAAGTFDASGTGAVVSPALPAVAASVNSNVTNSQTSTAIVGTSGAAGLNWRFSSAAGNFNDTY